MSDADREITEWLITRLKTAREERDRYRRWFEKLFEGAWRHADEDAELRATLEQVREEHDRVVNARTRKRQSTAADKRAEAIRRYLAGDLVKNIAKDLRRSERWVYETIPEDMKRRR